MNESMDSCKWLSSLHLLSGSAEFSLFISYSRVPGTEQLNDRFGSSSWWSNHAGHCCCSIADA